MMIYSIHAPKEDHLLAVTEEMRAMGAPTIRVVDCGDYFMALEGSHRLAAAHNLGLTPNFEVFADQEVIDITEFDWFDPENWAETTYPAGEIAGELFSPRQAVPYKF